MANAINSLNFGNNTYTFTLPYGSCSTAAGTAAKTVSVDNFSLETGARVAVKFTVTNTASSPTLNVNSTGAKAIYYKGAAITAGYLAANKVYEFIYNGTQWDLIGDVDTDTTYTLSSFDITATATELNYVGGVTSNIQAQLDSKLSTEAAGDLDFVDIDIEGSSSGFPNPINADTLGGILASEYITKADFAELKNCVTPQMYGAKGDGKTDDTKAINDAIEAVGNNGIVFFPEGTYLVSSSMNSSLGVSERYFAVKIYEKENITLQLSPNAHIKHKPFTEAEIKSANTTRYYVVGIMCSSNIKVVGGHIEGESAEHTYHTYQDDGTISRTHGYGINIYSSDDVVIRDCEISHCYGDGVHVSIASGYSKSNNAIIENCDIHDCVRLGMGICGANNTLVKDCRIHDIVGASPQSGIDFEPDYVSNMNIDSVVENCVIYNCANHTIINAKANRGVQIRDCKLYGKVTSTCDDTYPIEYNNCDIIGYQSSNAHRNVLRNCRIACVGMYEMGDDFYNCTFDPDLFNHIIEGYGSTVVNLIECGSAITSTSSARFYHCDFIANNNGAYASNFMLWRNNGQIGTAIFDGCTFNIGLHAYSGLNIRVLNDLCVQRCIFIAPEISYTKQFIEFNVPNRLVFKDNIIDLKPLTSYSTSYSSIIRLYTKDIYVEGNQLLAKTKICTYTFLQTFVNSVGEIYWLRNYTPLWDSLGSLASATASKFVSAGNILATTQSEVTFTEADKSKLDNIDKVISNSGFITEVEAKGYTDAKVADIMAQGSQLSPSFANTVNECTDTSKVYVLPDGDLYGYMMSMSEAGIPQFKDWLPLAIDSDGSIYNGVGYKYGWRLNSAGNVVEDTTGCVVTGFIPFKKGDILRFYNITLNQNNNMVIQYKSDFTKYGNPTYRSDFINEGNGVYKIETSNYLDTTAYIRLSVGSFSEDSVITVNEEIVYSVATATWGWKNTGHSFIKVLVDDIPADVATEAELEELHDLLNNKVDSEQLEEALKDVEVSDAKISKAISDYLTENPISGASGRGIVSITRTSGAGASGTTDTYTITYTDGTSTTYSVYNGKDGTNGKSAYDSAKTGGYTGTESAFNTALASMANLTSETWTFTLEDGSTVTKKVVLI